MTEKLRRLNQIGAEHFADWQARAAFEARDEQRRHPRWYPSTEQERLEIEYTPERTKHDEQED